MTFAYPWLLLLPIFYLGTRLLFRTRPAATPCPSSKLLACLPRSFRLKIREPLLAILAITSILCLAVAAARPQRITLFEQPHRARNIMLVVDASNSMSAQDFPTTLGYASRMDGAKSAVAEYVRSRQKDRIGLVVFGNTAYLQSPLTTDTALVEQLVNTLYPRMAGDGTAIGDGLGLALKRLRDVTGRTKAIILLTDGVNTAGQISPFKAAEIARDLKIQINTIGLGSGRAALGGMLGTPGRAVAEFDEESLKQIAQITGGAYFNANNLADLQEVYRKIEQLQESELEQPDRTIIEELYPPFVLVALLSYLLGVILSATYLLKVP
ncbi:MAG: VWA domain-containing protein [Proteobacteria bacterium]|nr:VWA domain-containing protein [Pseudomonadota bacterium]